MTRQAVQKPIDTSVASIESNDKDPLSRLVHGSTSAPATVPCIRDPLESEWVRKIYQDLVKDGAESIYAHNVSLFVTKATDDVLSDCFRAAFNLHTTPWRTLCSILPRLF